MKLSFVLCFITLLQMFATGYSQTARISLSMHDVKIEDVLDKIEEQSEFYFLYNQKLVDLNRKVSIDVSGKTINEVLTALFDKDKIDFAVYDRQIIVSPAGMIDAIETAQQGITITGTIVDATGEPMPGVNIMVKGTTTGAVTDVSGKYTIRVADENAVLVFSFIGYITQEYIVENRRNIDVTLSEETQQLDEVVVIGYGTAKRRDLTGATGRINASDLQSKPANNVMDFLRGTVAGFNSNLNSSAKGGGSLEIRGPTSIKATADPLIVVDGMIYNGDLADINPADIESMDILKDGSSAAVYGTRAAAGVLAITTRKGVSEKPVITFNASWGVSQLAKRQEVYGPDEYITMKGDARRSMDGFTRPAYYYRNPNELPAGVTTDMWLDGQTGDPMTIWQQGRLGMTNVEMQNYKDGKTTNWLDKVFQTGLRQDYNVGIAGKSKMTSYYFSLGYLNNEGIVVGDTYQNIRARLNLAMDVTKWLQIGVNAQFADRDQSTNPASWENAVSASPYGNMYEADGKTLKWFPHDDNLSPNPFNNAAADLMDKNTNITANLFANVQLPLGFKYQIIYNNRYAFSKKYEFYSIDTYKGRQTLTKDGDMLGGAATREDGSHYSWQVDNILTWNKTLADIHRLDFTFLFNAEKTQTWEGKTEASQFAPSDVLGFHNLNVGLASNLKTSDTDVYTTGNALMARVNYTLLDKYLLTASFRRDGFSAFGQNHPYAYFPAVALAWRLSEESFMNGTSNWLDYAKLRLSWGINGNRSIDAYAALAEVKSGKAVIDGSSVTRIYSETLANSDLKWEKTTAYNIGLDFAIFKNVLSGSIEGYMTSTNDLLLTRSLPTITAYKSVMANLGEITNKGMEITLNSTNIKRENFFWTSSFSFSFNRNQVKHLYGTKQNVLDKDGNVIGQREADDATNNWYIGQALDRIYGYEVVGVWQENEKDEAAKYGLLPGDMKLRDVSNFTGRAPLVRYEEDRVFQGYKKPRYRLGLRNDMNIFKHFDVSFFLRADLGHYGSNDNYKHRQNPYYNERLNTYKYAYWTPENAINSAARLNGNVNPDYTYYSKRSFLRLQDLSVSYTLPQNVLSAIHLQSARVFVNMSNLFTITGWDFWDPESSDKDDKTMPTPRIYSFGVNITL